MTTLTVTYNQAKNIEYINNTMFVINGDCVTFYSDEYCDDTGRRFIYFLKLDSYETFNLMALNSKYTESNLVLERYKRRLAHEENLITLIR